MNLDMLLDEGCQEGEFLGSKRSCDLYYVCVHGSRMEFRCQGGLQWNAEAKVCDWPSNVKCTPSEPSDPVSVPIMPPTRPTSAPTMTPTQPTATTPVPSWQTSPTTTTTERQTSATFPSLMPTSAPEVVRPPSSDLSGTNFF
jgi:chitinase